ncbi:SDR family NAD(P)-dependent oxidoreductase [Actinomycetospora aeridis]|uniref:SDR family NAD(P)-dependent oxidoreductase n=1 Tax=Actinomycetospora aeridis TaxID=3129231 RepID=A0ABU8MYB2_9PSEU
MPLPAPAPDAAVVVTGASSGIGAAVARELGRRGHPMVLVARSGDALADLAAELRALSGQDAAVHALDLGTDADLAAARELVDDDRVAGVVNAAGFGVTGRVAELADVQAALDGLVRVNVLALHSLTVAAVGALVRRAAADARPGAILNVSSITAFQPLPGAASYAASKAFVQSFSEAVHTELAGTGVTLTTLSPGLTRTGFADAAGTDFGRAPDLVVGEAADVAAAGVEAMVRGDRSVTPGLVNQLTALGGRLAPRTLLLPALDAGMDLYGA